MILARLGDVIAVRGTGWLSEGILAATSYSGHDGICSHVGIITSIVSQTAFASNSLNPIMHCDMTEAVTRVRTVPLFISLWQAQSAWRISLNNLSDDQRKIIVSTALSFSNDSYGYYEIGLQLFDSFFKTRWFTDKLSFAERAHPICSFLDACSYEKAGVNFGEPDQSVTPADIMRWAVDHPELASVEKIL